MATVRRSLAFKVGDIVEDSIGARVKVVEIDGFNQDVKVELLNPTPLVKFVWVNARYLKAI